MDWSTDEVLTFLRLYEREPGIWNPLDPNYKNRYRLNDSWKKIAEGLGGKYSISELKQKKLSLMATYRKLATKVRSGGDPSWRPEWFAFGIMDRFLKDVYEPKHEKLQYMKVEEERSGGWEEDTLDEEPEERQERLPDPASFLEVRVEDGARRAESPPTPEPPAQQPQAHQLNGRPECTSFSQLRSLFEKPEPDECSTFGEFVAKKLRAMDEEMREIAMLEVHNLLFTLKRKPRKAQISLSSDLRTQGSSTLRNSSIKSEVDTM